MIAEARRARTPLLVAALAAAIPGAARADTLALHDGRFVEAPKIEKKDAAYALRFPSGEVVVPVGWGGLLAATGCRA